MKQNLLVAALIASGANVAMAENVVRDTLSNYDLKAAEVTATRATRHTPIAFTNLDKKDIAKKNFGQDLTYLLLGTPSVLTTSDAGTGIGYTSLRVRGTDATRINITNNGIPVNDAESHAVFWVNMPDFASSVKDIQIQRGVGTSTNGAGAFGASVNMQTATLNPSAYGEVNASYGSFNTHKETVKFGTGLINNHWTFDGRLSNIGSDGYLDRADVSLNSYYMQTGFFSNATSVKFILFGAKEKTYHAWNYSTKEQMEAFGRKFNGCGYMNMTDAEGNISRPDVDYDGVPAAKEILNAGGHFNYYEDQTDNYIQTNAQLLIDHSFNNNWKLNAGLHYTKGDGFYQEYKDDRKLYQFGLNAFQDANGDTHKKSDLIRKKAMDNHFGGAVAALQYNNQKLHATLGGGYNYYEGDHFGRVLWVKNYLGELNPDKDYYRNTGKKNDGNIYLKAEYEFLKGLTGYADVQYRHIRYQIDGQNDKWNDMTNALQVFDIDEKFDFCNPKVGLNWQPNRNHRVFGSVSMAHKEPTRNNYTDGHIKEHPTSEQLLDYELGYQYVNKYLQLGANLYFMDYKDQLVLTGELNEIGEAVAANIPDSYRAGIELMAGLRLPCGFTWDINATLSRNRIKDFEETLYGYDADWNDLSTKVQHGDTHIAFSPDFILNNRFGYSWKGLEASLQTQYVSEQYMSNADIEEHKLDAYFVSNLSLAYTFNLKAMKSLTIGATVYNLFNEEYENNGWASSDFNGHVENGKVVIDKRNSYTGYAAQAGTNFLVNLNLNF